MPTAMAVSGSVVGKSGALIVHGGKAQQAAKGSADGR